MRLGLQMHVTFKGETYDKVLLYVDNYWKIIYM